MYRKSGFTLIEMLIVVAIIGLLTVSLFMTMRKQRSKAEDARVKADLQQLKIAFEDYYNDNNCYPPATMFDAADDCGSAQLKPYLSSMPCDRKTGVPYKLEYVPTQCSGFRLYATLQNTQDPDVQALSDPSGSTLGNYGVSSDNTTVRVIVPSMDGSLPEGHTYYYCSVINNCSRFDPVVNQCTPFYTDDPYCGGTMGDKCAQAGSCQAR